MFNFVKVQERCPDSIGINHRSTLSISRIKIDGFVKSSYARRANLEE